MEEGEIIEVGDESVKFCGEVTWKKTSMSCNKRVAFLVDTYHITSIDAKRSLVESDDCLCINRSGSSGGSGIQEQTKPTIALSPTTVLPLTAGTNSTSIATKQFENDETQDTGMFVIISLSLLATLVIMTHCSREGLFYVYSLGFILVLYQSSLLLYMPQQRSFGELISPLPETLHVENNVGIVPMKVWYYKRDFPSRSYNSTKIMPSMDKDEDTVSWIIRLSEMPDIVPIAAERMMVRLEEELKQKSGSNAQEWSNISRTNITGYLRNVSQDELNNINPEWKVFIFDHSDRGVGPWGLWFMETELASLIGWKRIHYITRTTQDGHHMDSWVTQSKTNSQVAKDFSGFFGKPTNFTEHLGKACASVQRKTYEVRDDINDAVDDYVRQNFPSAFESADNNVAMNSLAISHAVANLPRPMDVRTFWNRTVCSSRAARCNFRSYLSDQVASFSSKHPSMKVNTDVIGFIHKSGRNNVSPEYIKAMLSTKIIVLGQRDKWEGHLRLMEGLLSGALVLHDPQVYWPYGVVDGVNIVVYHSILDLEEKILYYLNPVHAQERILIGQRGREVALSKNRYWDNMERLLLDDESKYVNAYGVSYHRWEGHGNP